MRLPHKTSDEVDEDPTGNKSFWDRGVLNGASHKVDVLCNIHIGETVLSLQKATLIPGGSESLVYTTLSGAIGVLVPFTSREDHDFFQALEMHLRSENPPLCGRDHLAFRSFYFPVKVFTLLAYLIFSSFVIYDFLYSRMLLMEISVNNLTLLIPRNKKPWLMIWIELPMRFPRN